MQISCVSLNFQTLMLMPISGSCLWQSLLLCFNNDFPVPYCLYIDWNAFVRKYCCSPSFIFFIYNNVETQIIYCSLGYIFFFGLQFNTVPIYLFIYFYFVAIGRSSTLSIVPFQNVAIPPFLPPFFKFFPFLPSFSPLLTSPFLYSTYLPYGIRKIFQVYLICLLHQPWNDQFFKDSWLLLLENGIQKLFSGCQVWSLLLTSVSE